MSSNKNEAVQQFRKVIRAGGEAGFVTSFEVAAQLVRADAITNAGGAIAKSIDRLTQSIAGTAEQPTTLEITPEGCIVLPLSRMHEVTIRPSVEAHIRGEDAVGRIPAEWDDVADACDPDLTIVPDGDDFILASRPDEIDVPDIIDHLNRVVFLEVYLPDNDARIQIRNYFKQTGTDFLRIATPTPHMELTVRGHGDEVILEIAQADVYGSKVLWRGAL